MRRMAVKTLALVTVLIMAASVMALPAMAAVTAPPYEGFNYDPYGVSTAAPVGYLPDETIDYLDMNLEKPLQAAQDLFVYDNKEIWISDSKGVEPEGSLVIEEGATVSENAQYGRVIVLDTNFKFQREYTHFTEPDGTVRPIPEPQGLFVKYNEKEQRDEMFVCCNLTIKTKAGKDRKAGYVVCADMDGNVIRTYTCPKSTVSSIKDFQPLSVVVDDSGYLYLQAYGVLDGIIVYNYETAEFSTFFGANKVVLTWQMVVQQTIKKIFSRKATKGLLKAVPTEISNMFIDDEGFIYTTTGTETVEKELRVRKLNASGTNTLQGDSNALVDVVFGEREKSYTVVGEMPVWSDTRLQDIVVNEDGVMAVMDVERSRIYLYDQTCMLLTAFGYKAGSSTVEGSISFPTAIDILGDRFLVLDNGRGTIIPYHPTEYMNMLLEANRFYTDGRYVEGEPYWRNVLKYDANFARGYAAIGKSLREQHDYQGSLYWLEQGQDRTSYSLALQEYRKEYLRANYMWLVPVAVVAVVAFVLLVRFIQKCLGIKRKKKRIKFS